ncbi:hypothetical protein J6590_044315 [Homalodisca vitripennis]|nr:hypothetical protein J6590_044315 [Homalodisca vitripennis]
MCLIRYPNLRKTKKTVELSNYRYNGPKNCPCALSKVLPGLYLVMGMSSCTSRQEPLLSVTVLRRYRDPTDLVYSETTVTE